jgi:hypothetical protein
MHLQQLMANGLAGPLEEPNDLVPRDQCVASIACAVIRPLLGSRLALAAPIALVCRLNP